MSKQNADVLARTARSEAERITKGDKRTIAAIINNWNECVKQSGFWCIYDFPTTGYTRKSQLVADLLRCADQLDGYVEPNPHAAQTVEQQTREFNAALTRVLDVEAAHAEALEMNAETDRRHHLSVMASIQNTIMERDDLPELVEACHAEALEMNAETYGISVSNSKQKIMRIRDLQYYFCGTCFEVMDKKTKALFDFCKPELQQAFPDHGEEELFSVFSQKFSRELNDYILFDHFTAIRARPQSCVIRGVVLGVRFDALSSAIRANGYNSVH